MRLWWPDAWLIARREIAERARAKSLRITTAIMILGVAAAVIVPTIVGHHQSTEQVGLVGAAGPSLRQAVTAAGRVTGDRVELRAVASVALARTQLKSGALSVAIVDGREILIKKQPVSGSTCRSRPSPARSPSSPVSSPSSRPPRPRRPSPGGSRFPSAVSRGPPRALRAGSPGWASPS